MPRKPLLALRQHLRFMPGSRIARDHLSEDFQPCFLWHARPDVRCLKEVAVARPPNSSMDQTRIGRRRSILRVSPPAPAPGQRHAREPHDPAEAPSTGFHFLNLKTDAGTTISKQSRTIATRGQSAEEGRPPTQSVRHAHLAACRAPRASTMKAR